MNEPRLSFKQGVALFFISFIALIFFAFLSAIIANAVNAAGVRVLINLTVTLTGWLGATRFARRKMLAANSAK